MAKTDKLTQALDEMCRMFTMCAPSNSITEARFDAANSTAREELAALLAERDGLRAAAEAADRIPAFDYRPGRAPESAYWQMLSAVLAYRAARPQVQP